MKLVRVIPKLVIAWCLLVLFYGIVSFPDAPFRPCDDGAYCGKQGAHHTAQEYARFDRWQTMLIVSWPFGLLVAFSRRKRDTAPAPTN